MDTIKVVKGESIPEERKMFKYPHQEMDVGDSFVVPLEWKQNVFNANCRAGKRLGMKFTARTEGEVVRTWRVY